MLGRPRRLLLLAEGAFTPTDAKTAVGVLRYRPEEVAAVLDSTRAGRTAQDCVGFGGGVPVVGSVAEAVAHGADALLIGIAPQGGELPAAWRNVVLDALGRGWDVLSGLHQFLADDPALAAAARASGATLHDVRRPPAARPVGGGRASRLPALVVLTVGSDCNVGKMTASLELVQELRRRGRRAAFLATGQTGIFIADAGVAVDAVPADFVAGLVETEVGKAAQMAETVVVEGQGSIHHPGYSGVTLGLLHGSCPGALVLCHEAGRDRIRGGAGALAPPIRPLAELVRDNETAAAWLRPAPVVAVALNTHALGEADARAAVRAAERDTGLPATDPVRFGAGPLADAVLAHASRRPACA
jgi:uncharacterized NAD-dependent epimerase/dehydratase family protein